MRQRTFPAVLSIVVTLFFAGGVLAATAGLDAKIAEQRKLIDKAAASKSLTKDEEKIVRENLKRIRERKQSAAADGRLDWLEEGNIQNMLARNNRMITDKKNNPVRPFDRPEITHRFENQQKRIDAGIKSGTITKQEGAKLQDNLTKAKAKYAELTKDGKFTQAEEKKMHEQLDRDSAAIHRKKEN